MVDYKLVRTNRKTLAIHISSDAQVVVRAPLRLSIKVINNFVVEKQGWILKKLDMVTKTIQHKQNLNQIKQGDSLLYLGKEYPVVYGIGKNASFDGNQFVIPKDDDEKTKTNVVNLYKKLAKTIIMERVYIYHEKMDVKPSIVKISSAKKRWGSCSGKDNLNFSYLLIMADLNEVDYVVVHELAHIKQHNHSPAFWALVFDVMPDYEQREKNLRELQQKI